MCDNLFNPSELKFLWKHRGNKDYDLKSFIFDGTFIRYMLFEDLRNKRKLLGKIVTSPKEGEAYHWPRLQHENLAPLVNIVAINEKISIYISPVIGSNLKIKIHDSKFLCDSECFNRKKAYSEDILWALDYLHTKNLCLLNLTELAINISEISDKAIICDFSCVHLIEMAQKECVILPELYKAPELKTGYFFNPISVETWACGVMLLQVFTGHTLPSAFIGDEVHQVLQSLKEINYDIVKDANPSAQIDFSIIEDLRSFLKLFIVENPSFRVNIRTAAVSPFLKCTRKQAVNNVRCQQASEPNKNFEHPWAFDQSKWMSCRLENLNSATFRDIYMQEVANCRRKLKKIPSTNKFINLDFVSPVDNKAQYPEKSYCNINEKTNAVKGDWDREKILEDTLTSESRSEYSSKESLIGDNTEFSKTFENTTNLPLRCEKSNVNKTESLNLRKISQNFGDVTAIKIKGGDDSVGIQKLDPKITLHSPRNNKETEDSDAKSHSSIDTDISVDSLDSSNNNDNERKEEGLAYDTFEDLDLISQDTETRKYELGTEKIFPPESDIPHTKITRVKSETIERDSDSSSWNEKEQTISYNRYSRSDTCIDALKDRKDKVGSDLTCCTTHSDEDHSRIITILDSIKLIEVSLNNSVDYKGLNHEIAKKESAENFKSEIALSEAFSQSTFSDGTLQENKKWKIPEDYSPKYDGDLVDGNDQPKTDNTETIADFHHQLPRSNSYKQALSSESVDKAESNDLPECETKATVKENSSKTRKFRSLLKFPFISTKNSSAKSKEVIDNTKSKKGEQNSSVVSDEDHTSVSCSQSSNSIEVYLDDSRELFSKETKKSKRRSWMKFLCPGSKS